MGVIQTGGGLQDVVDGVRHRQRPLVSDQRSQIPARDIFHHQEMDAVRLIGIVRGDDVRM